jgi:hypothetical protein
MAVACYAAAAAWQWWLGRGAGKSAALRSAALRVAATLALCLLATLINPYGWTIYQYVGGTSAVAYQRQIAEWVRPGPDRLIGIMWIASIAVVVGLLAWRWTRTRRLPTVCDVLLLGCFLALSAGSARMVPWWILVSAPVLAELLVWAAPQLGKAEGDAKQPSVIVGGVFTLIVLAFVFSLPGLAEFNPLLGPTRRGQRLEDDLEAIHRHLETTAAPGNIYSHFEWGEYLSWSVTPQWKIFMDGRIEIYPDEVWEKYMAVTAAKSGWQEILDEYVVGYLILDSDLHGRSGLLARVEESSHWQQAFQTHSAVLFVRSRNCR